MGKSEADKKAGWLVPRESLISFTLIAFLIRFKDGVSILADRVDRCSSVIKAVLEWLQSWMRWGGASQLKHVRTHEKCSTGLKRLDFRSLLDSCASLFHSIKAISQSSQWDSFKGAQEHENTLANVIVSHYFSLEFMSREKSIQWMTQDQPLLSFIILRFSLTFVLPLSLSHWLSQHLTDSLDSSSVSRFSHSFLIGDCCCLLTHTKSNRKRKSFGWTLEW